MTKRDDAKNTMFAHSQAKVEFFEAYLQRYLRILYRTPFVTSINIFDVFCGTGIYENGKKGSPIVAFETIKSLHIENTTGMKIRLIINDGEASRVDCVKAYLEDKNLNFCEIEYNTLVAAEMFNKVIKEVNSSAQASRNLIFIDPYGYKEVHKETLLNLLSNNRTEIILFLPVSHMQRFTQKALLSQQAQYEPLRRFVNSFFNEDHPIHDETKPVHEYIDYIKYALRFNDRYYSTSYTIQRDAGNYYALFFITNHLYGYEKILEVKWALDGSQGRGFAQPKIQQSLFAIEEQQEQEESNYKQLENLLREYLRSPRTNKEVYKYILQYEFLPTHAIKIFNDWQKLNGNFEVTEIVRGIKVRNGRYYISWEHCKPQAAPKVRLYLKY